MSYDCYLCLVCFPLFPSCEFSYEYGERVYFFFVIFCSEEVYGDEWYSFRVVYANYFFDLFYSLSPCCRDIDSCNV